MEMKRKEFYEAPSMMISEVKQEGVVCVSGGEYPQWDSEDI